MGILKYFTPDRMEKDIFCYPSSFFKERGIDRVAFDIDNTIAAYDCPLPSDRARAYLLDLKAAGVDIMLVSNNNEKRVDVFNAEFGFFAVADAHKPSAKGIVKCFAQSKNKGGCAFVGDQIFTDCLAARRAGVSCFLVQPIQPVENLFFKFKRFCEKPFVRHYKKLVRKGKI